MKFRSVFIISVLLILFVLPAQAQRAEGRSSVPSAGPRAPVGGTNPPLTSVRDGGFEGSYDTSTFYKNDDWRVNDSLFRSPICKVSGCGENPSFAAPRSGTHWAYFGATEPAESGFIEQKVILPDTASLELKYYVWASFSGVAPTLKVRVDGTVVDTFPAGTTVGYALRIVNLTPYADGRVHKIRFSYSKPSGGSADINIDDISLYKGESIAIPDPGFEVGSDWWTVVNKTADKVACNTATKTISHSGDCAFRFKGSAGENSQLKLSYGLLRSIPDIGNRAAPTYAVYLGAYVKAPASVRGTMKLTLTLTDNSKIKAKVALSGNGNYKWIQTPYTTYVGTQGIIAILIGVVHRSQSGKIYLDDFEIFQVPFFS